MVAMVAGGVAGDVADWCGRRAGGIRCQEGGGEGCRRQRVPSGHARLRESLRLLDGDQRAGRDGPPGPVPGREETGWRFTRRTSHWSRQPYSGPIGAAYTNLGNHSEAESQLRAAVAITTRAVGDAHPDTAESLLALGNLRVAQGQWSEAETLIRRALGIQRAALGEKHLKVGEAIQALSVTLVNAGRGTGGGAA